MIVQLDNGTVQLYNLNFGNFGMQTQTNTLRTSTVVQTDMKARFYSTGYDFLYSALININSATYANYQGIVVNSLDSRRTTSFWT